MGVDKRGKERSEAQEAAARKNLRKGNKKAYSKPPPEAPPPAAEAEGKQTIRAKASTLPPKPKARRTPPRAPARDEPAEPKRGGGGFWSGLAEGIRG